MPPLDDELRAALHGRAATLTPSPDPLAGVERRARGLRRRRVGASVAGTALAVLAVAGAVPLLAPDRTAPAPGDVATSAPSPSPSPAASPYAFDPEQPWEYRGDRAVLGDGTLEEWRREWAVREPGAELVPLYGRVWEPSGLPEVVFASVSPTRDELVYGVATTSETGARFLVAGDTPRRSTTSFAVVLPGDEGGQRLTVVAAPDVERLQYSSDGESLVELAPLAPGVGVTPVVPTAPDDDAYVVVGQDGEVVERAGVPDQPARADDEASPASAPANVVEWGPRGSIEGDLVLAARQAYASTRAADPGQVEEKVLFAGEDGGQRFLLGQFWLRGEDRADTFGAVVDGQGRVGRQLYRPLQDDTGVTAMQLPPAAGRERGRLVVVPRPRTGQVEYAADDAREWVPKTSPGLDGVVVLTRAPQPDGGAVDRLRLHDGNGVVFLETSVADLICERTGCG